MARFDPAYQRTMRAEGQYADDPHDPGGETYAGVARNFHPSWPGWERIDKWKAQRKAWSLALDEVVQQQVADFYRAEFWNRLWGDQLADQRIAEELFDTAVNGGRHHAIEFLQRALNVCNNRGTLYPDIAEDGAMGKGTVEALDQAVKLKRARAVCNVMNILQGARYVELMRARAENERYIGWFDRVEIVRNG